MEWVRQKRVMHKESDRKKDRDKYIMREREKDRKIEWEEKRDKDRKIEVEKIRSINIECLVL